ncbi:MAG: FprA family A-type flavoprotein [Spirochaetota bacterium]
MAAVEIGKGVFWIGVNDRTTDLFEGLWPITQEGVSYNSYIINDEKKVLIDLAKAIKTDVFFDHIAEIVEIHDLDYLVINHMEPDHTGVLRTLKRMSPKLTILCAPKAKSMLKNYYEITANIREVQDGEKLNTGTRELQFFHIPFVHWPETMATYDLSEKILFSCDAFGGYGALTGAIFDDECHDLEFYKQESLRYYANIIAKFSKPVLNAIEKLKEIPIEVIAPSHGLIWRKNPGVIVQLYKQWAEYAAGKTNPAITLVYGSMYGNTETMMNAVAQGISRERVPVEIFDVARTHASYILASLWTRAGVMIGAPTYEAGLFPPMTHILEMAVLKRILNKTAAMFGSFGWSGGALKEIKRVIEPLNWELNDTFEFQGGPTEENLRKGEEFGSAFARKIKTLSV